MIWNFLLVGLGGALGAMARYALSLGYVYGLGWQGFWATMSANLLGSFLMGMSVVAIFGDEPVSTNAVAAFLMTGLLGGFTTFSAFSLDGVNLIQSCKIGTAMFYIFATVTLSIFALLFGMAIMRGRGQI